MPSILPGYKYDIFISYRQNDNKHDGWVSKFVQALRDELEATLKNPVSIYFDENPHDGLLETHQVGATLEKKLKCLVFIPIISQTYCDPKSFAWEHEFLPFLSMSKEDELGMNITLSNGNVASRVLPVQIHELDPEDGALLTETLAGPLRSIDFIYKESGVNRPLRSEDNDEKNTNKTSYRNQINKVANALKDLGTSILRSNNAENSVIEKPTQYSEKETGLKRNNIIIAAVVALILILGYWGYSEYYDQKRPLSSLITNVSTHKIIAVLPFANTKPDPDNDYLGFAIATQVIGALDHNKNLTVRPSSAVRKYDQQIIDAKSVADDLKVSYVLTGNYLMVANIIRLNIELVDTKTNTSLWRDEVEVDFKSAFELQDMVAQKVVNGLDIQFSEKELDIIRTDVSADPLAYEYFLRGLSYPISIEGSIMAIEMFKKSIAIDSNYAPTYAHLGHRVNRLLLYASTTSQDENTPETYYNKALSINENQLDALVFLSSRFTETGHTIEAYETINKALKISPNNAQALFYLGYIYRYAGMLEESVAEMEKAVALDPANPSFRSIGIGYYNLGDDANAYRGFALDKASLYELGWQAFINYRNKDYNKVLEQTSKAMAIDSVGLWGTNFRIMRAMIKGDLNEGLRWTKYMEEITTDAKGNVVDAEICYYNAAFYAGVGAKKDALRQLRNSVENGYFNYPFMVTDDFFSSLREDSEYQAILALAKKKHLAFKEEFFNN